MNTRFKNIEGKVFGRWMAVFRTSQAKGYWKWMCQCACGTFREVSIQLLSIGHSKSCGCVRTDSLRINYHRWTPTERKQISERMKGVLNHMWKGGQAKSRFYHQRSVEYKLWREAVFKRDKYTCRDCGAHSGEGQAVILHADHIKAFAHFPELRFDVKNGRTLCIDCHKQTPNYGGKARSVFKQYQLTNLFI